MSAPETDLSLSHALHTGNIAQVVARLVEKKGAERQRLAKPLVKESRAMLEMDTTTLSNTYKPEQRRNFATYTSQLWDCATLILLAAKTPQQAAKVWPLPDLEQSLAAIPQLFPDHLGIFVEQWSQDYCSAPRNYDRNRNREVCFEWVEQGLAPIPTSDASVLYFLCALQIHAVHPGTKPTHGGYNWLKEHPRLRQELFPRLLTTPGIKGASLEQFDHNFHDPNETIGQGIIPRLILEGALTYDWFANGVHWGLSADLSSYQRRWYRRAAKQLDITISSLDHQNGDLS